MSDRLSFYETAKRLTSTSFVRVKPNKRTQTINTKWLGYLVLESLRKYASNPATFGRSPRSLNGAMKPMLDRLIGTGTRRENRTRKHNLLKLVDAYRRGPRHRARREVHSKRVASYLSQKTETIFSNCVREMFANRLIPSSVALKDQPSIDDRQCRRIYATLLRVHCHNDSEWTSDEPYLLTGATLSDSSGIWMKETECSNYAGSVDAGEYVSFSPPSIKRLFDWQLENPSDEYSLSPVTALCTITLMEHDQGSKERHYQAFQAAYSTARLLVAIAEGGAGGPIGVAIAIVSILISVFLALDGDDELKTIAMQFNDVLGGASVDSQSLRPVIEGYHKGNYYKYEFTVSYGGEDYDCPVGVPFWITGPTKRTIMRAGGTTTGGYAIVCPAPLEAIVWKVSPRPASIAQQGGRYTRISFPRPGDYKVSVTAKEQSGIASHSNEISVRVTERQQQGPIP